MAFAFCHTAKVHGPLGSGQVNGEPMRDASRLHKWNMRAKLLAERGRLACRESFMMAVSDVGRKGLCVG